MHSPKLLSLIFVFDSSSRVLLGLKRRGFGAGKYNGFGGKLEPGETMRACAARELEEESGLRVAPTALTRRGVLTFNMLADGMVSADGAIVSRLEIHVFSCRFADAEGEVLESSDEMVPSWWPCDEVPLAQMWADDQHWLPSVFAGDDVIGDFVFRDEATILEQRVEVLPPGRLQRDEERTRRLRIDHLVFGVPGTLEEACAAFEQKTGVAPLIGGVHRGLGTHNALVALGGPDDGSAGASCGYLEILALDPKQQPTPERLWMAMEGVVRRGEPRMVTWATDRAEPPGLEAAVAAAAARGFETGAVQAFARDTADGRPLAWKLAYRHYDEASLPADGLVPFLIEWDAACRSYAPAAGAPRGCELLSLQAAAGAAHEEAAAGLAAVGIDPADLLVPGALPDARGRLVATLRTPKGIVELS